jgi:hypothetical protein
MQRGTVFEHRRISAMQPVEGFQPDEPYDPLRESYRLMCAHMISTFVGDLERYERLQKRKHIPVSPNIRHQNAMIEMNYWDALRWAVTRTDWFLSIDECCETVGIDPDEFLARHRLA